MERAATPPCRDAAMSRRRDRSRKKNLEIQGYYTNYRPVPYSSYQLSDNAPVPSLLPLSFPPSFLCLWFPGCGPGARCTTLVGPGSGGGFQEGLLSIVFWPLSPCPNVVCGSPFSLLYLVLGRPARRSGRREKRGAGRTLHGPTVTTIVHDPNAKSRFSKISPKISTET